MAEPQFKWKCTQDKFIDILSSKGIYRECLGTFGNQNWFLDIKVEPINEDEKVLYDGDEYEVKFFLFLTRDKTESSIYVTTEFIPESQRRLLLNYFKGLGTLFIGPYRYTESDNSSTVTMKFTENLQTQKDELTEEKSIYMAGDNPEETDVTFICGSNKLKVQKSVLDMNAAGFLNKFTKEENIGNFVGNRNNGASEDDRNKEDDRNNGASEDDRNNGASEDERNNGASEDDRNNGASEDDRNNGASEDDRNNGASEDDRNNGASEDDRNNGASNDKCVCVSNDEKSILDGFEIVSPEERSNRVSEEHKNVSGDENLLGEYVVLDENNRVVSLETKLVSDDDQNTILSNSIELVVQDLTYSTLWNIMNFIYTGSDFSFTNKAEDYDMIRNLIAADQKYEIQGMKEKLLKNLRELFTADPLKVLEVLDWYDIGLAVELIRSFETMLDFGDLEQINIEMYKQICRVWLVKINLETL